MGCIPSEYANGVAPSSPEGSHEVAGGKAAQRLPPPDPVPTTCLTPQGVKQPR